MPDGTINLEIKVDAREALANVSAFSDGVKQKMSEVDQVIKKTDENFTSIGTSDKNGFLDSQAVDTRNVISTVNDSLEKMKSGFAAMENMLSSTKMSNSMTSLFESFYRTMSSSIQKINQYSDSVTKSLNNPKGFDPSKFVGNDRERNVRLSAASGVQAANEAKAFSAFLQENLSNGGFGLNGSQLDAFLPAIKQFTEKRIESAQRSMRGTASVDDLVRWMSKDDTYRKALSGAAGGKSFSEKEAQNIARLFAMSSRADANRNRAQYRADAGFEEELKLFQTDYFPKAFQAAFANYGHVNDKPTPSRSPSASAHGGAYSAIRNLVRGGNAQAIELARAVGLVRARNGAYEFSGNANQAQIETLAGLAMRGIHDAKTSLPYHYIDARDISQEERLMQRQNKAYEGYMDIVNSLAKYNITPNVYAGANGRNVTDDINSIIKNNDLFAFQENGMQKYNRKQTMIKTLGNKDMFVVPQTTIDANGHSIYRDPSWKKESPLDRTENDHFVAIGRSAFTDLLGMHGTNTFGYGRDENGKSVYGTPQILRLNTSELYGEIEGKDGKRRIGVLPEKQAIADRYNRLFNRQETMMYGEPGLEREYIAAYADEQHLVMMLKDQYDKINKEYDEAGLESPFGNMNIKGRFGKGTYSGAMKAVDLERKRATPGHRYESLGYDDTPLSALVDFTALYKYAGIDSAKSALRENEMIDGVSYFDPSVLPFNAQMRMGFVNKFMGQRENWRKLLYGSKLLEKAYKSEQNRGLITLNPNNKMAHMGDGYSFFVPQIGLAESISKDHPIEGMTSLGDMIQEMNRIQMLIDKGGKNGKAGATDDEVALLNRLRNNYFFDIMNPDYKALITDTSVKNDDKWRLMTRRHFNTMFSGQEAAGIREAGTNRDEDILELTAAQQAEHMRKAAEMSGLWIVNSANDFATDKDFIPESLATAMGLGLEERTKSNVAYSEYIKSLQYDENARRDYLNTTSLGRMLVASGAENSSLAEMLIAGRISDMEAKKTNGHIYMPGAGPEIRLTGAMPGSVAGPIFKGLFGVTADETNKYGKLFNYNNEDKVLMRTMSEEERVALGANAAAARRMMLSRMPAAPGEYAPDAENIGDLKMVQRAMDALGMEYDDTVYTNPALQYRLMTGDYDGDTAWLVRGLSSDAVERMRRYAQLKKEAAQKIAERTNGVAQVLQEREYVPGTELTDAQSGAIQATVDMGTTTAAIRNAMVGMDDDDPNKWLTIAQAINEYDLATSETKKKGASITMSRTTANAARQGALFRRFVKQINAFSDDSQNSNPRIFASRLPLANETSELADMAFNFAARRRGEGVGDVFSAHLDEWLNQTYGDMNTPEARAASQYAFMMKNIMTGKRLNDKSDISIARDLAFEWSNDLEKRRRAGESVTEEQSRLSSYIYRLDSLEKEGATTENITARRNSLIGKQKELRAQGNDSEANALQGLIDVYRSILTPFSTEMAEVDKIWYAEKDGLEKEIKERIDKANEVAKGAGVDTSRNIGLMNQVFKRNPAAQAKMNWSDVTPWLYQAMMDDRAKGNRFALSGIQKRNERTGDTEALPGDEFFNPYPHTDEGIDEQRVKIMAREIGHGLGIIPDYEETGATVMGSIRHKAFENYLKQRMSGKEADISSIYATALSTNGYDGLDLSVEQAQDGSYVLKGLAAKGLEDGVNKALGSFNPSSMRFTGGTLQAFVDNVIEKTLANGGRVANIEAGNYTYDSNGNVRLLNEQEISGRGAKIAFPIYYKNAYGHDVQKTGTFAPDLVMADANSRFDMYDYKSGRGGAMDALFQMMVYAKDIQNKANAWRNIENPEEAAAEREKAKRFGWDQYVDENGNLKFNAFHAFDTTNGNTYSIDADQKTIDKMYDYYTLAQKEKMKSAESGEYIKRGAAYLQQQLDARQGGGLSVTNGATGDIQGAIYKSNAIQGSEAYKAYIAQKFARDDETLKEITGNLFKQDRRFGNVDFGGYSQYSGWLKQLDDMVSPETIEKMRQEMGDDETAKKELLAFQERVRKARDHISANERLAAVKGFSDISSSMRSTLFGTKGSGALGSISSIQRQIDNAIAVREGMKNNPDQYNSANNEWVSEGAKVAYENSIKAQKKLEEEANTLIPQVADRQIAANKKSFETLLPENDGKSIQESVSEYYDKRYESVEKFVNQQDSYIEEYQEALDKKNADGTLYYEEGSANRKAIQKLLEDAKNRRKEAGDILADNDYWSAFRQSLTDRANASIDLQTNQANAAYEDRMLHGNQLRRNRYGNQNAAINRVLSAYDNNLRSARRYSLDLQQDIFKTQESLRPYVNSNGQIKDSVQGTERVYAEKLQANLAGYRKELEAAQADEQNLTGVTGGLTAAYGALSQAVSNAASRLGRQIFHKALQETKRFVQDFNKSMTEIQMITLKSDAQIQDLGNNLIETAKNLKISVSEISSSAATLYRQGLSDAEVSDRLEVISKFSKVSGTKIDAATKLVTVAMNTGLVSNATEAADIVTALGDSAATNASEIEKGIEKAGAAAAADGTTFGQLAAMLTAITSTTQIGGNVAGRTLNTIMGRMNKIGTNELIYDENGNAVSGSAVAQMLQAQGISMYDARGNKRSTFDTLYALSQKWEGMADAEQQQIANAIAGTRQYSNFAAVMQGMAEGDIDRYMELIGESSGITDQKFDIYTQSLEASLTNLRSTFDGLVNDLTSSGFLTGFIDDISKAIQGVDNLANSVTGLTGGFGGLVALAPTLLPILAGLALFKTGNPKLMLAGLAIAGIGYGIASFAGTRSATETYESSRKESNADYSSWNTKIDRASELNKKAILSDSEKTELEGLKQDLSFFTEAGAAMSDAAQGADTLNGAVTKMGESAKNTAELIEAARKQNELNRSKDALENIDEQAAAYAEQFEKDMVAASSNAVQAGVNYTGTLFTKDGNGRYALNKSSIMMDQYATSSDESKRSFQALINSVWSQIKGDYDDSMTPEALVGMFGRGNNDIITDASWATILSFLNTYDGKSPEQIARESIEARFTDAFGGYIYGDELTNAVSFATNDFINGLNESGIDFASVSADDMEKLFASGLSKYYGFKRDENGKLSIPESIPEQLKQLPDELLMTEYENYVDQTNSIPEWHGIKPKPADFETWKQLAHPEIQTTEESVSEEQEEEIASHARFSTALANASMGNKSYQEKNKVGLASDLLISRMVSSNYGEGVEGLQKFINDLNADVALASAWDTVLANIPELEGLTTAQTSVDENDVVRRAAPDVMGQIYRTLLGSGINYKTADLTTKELAGLAQQGITGLQNGWFRSANEQETAIAYHSARPTGDTEYATYLANQQVVSAEQISAMQKLFGVDLANRIVGRQNLSDLEQQYLDGILGMSTRGATEYTAQERLANLQRARAGAYTQRTAGAERTEEEILKQYLSGSVSDVDDYLYLTDRSRRNELSKEEASRLSGYEKELADYREKLRLEAAKTNATTMSGAYNYAKLQYRQNNKASYAADQIFGDLSSVRNAEDLIRVMGASSTKDNFKELIDAYPELSKAFKDFGLDNYFSSGEASAESLSSLTTSAGGLSEAFVALMTAVAGASEAFNKQQEVYSNGQTYSMAQAYLRGEAGTGSLEETNFAALSEVLGNTNLANSVRNAYNGWLANRPTLHQGDTFVDGKVIDEQGHDVSHLYDMEAFGEFNPYAGLSESNAEYARKIFENAEYGISGLTESQRFEGLQRLIGLAQNGGLYGENGFRATDKVGEYQDYVSAVSGAEQWLQLAELLQSKGQDIANLGSITENMEGYEEYVDAAKQIYGSLENAQTANEEFSNSVVETSNRLKTAGKYSDAFSLGLKRNSKDLKTSNDALRDSNKFLDDILKRQNARTKFREGKLGGGVADQIAEDTGKTKKDVKNKKNKNEIEEQLKMQEQQDIKAIESYGNGFLTEANNILAGMDWTLEAPPVEVTAGGEVDFSALEGAIEPQIIAALQELAAWLAEQGISTHFEWTEGEFGAPQIQLKVDKLGSGGGHGGGGGGGGGSEKSEAQKMLDRHKHEVKEAEHAVKMQEIYQTHYDFINDYDSYIGSLEEEEKAYDNLSAVYQRQIGEMESMLGGLEAYSDDWWAVKEALDAARESLADVQNKIDAIETKRVEIIVQKQENEDKPSTQKQNLWTEKARSYQVRGQFESYAVSEGKRIEEIDEQRKLNEEQIKELEKTLNETTEGGDAWLKARDQIWALQVESAKLANDQEEARRALQLATVEQAKTDLQNRITPRTHEQSMLDSWGTLYQNNRQHDYYRNVLGQQNDMSNQNIGLYTQYIAKLREQIDTVEKGSEAWYAARDAIYEYEEAIAQATVSIDENNRAIEQSKIDELKKEYEDINKDLSHQDNVLKTQQDRYDKNGNFTMYQEVIGTRLGVANRNLAELKRQLDGYLAIQGEITEGTDQWDELTDAIRSTSEQYEQQINEVEELQRLAAQSKFEHDQETFDRQNNLDEHLLKMIQYEESMYQNRGELTNQNTMIGIENEQRRKMVASLQDYLAVLQEDLDMAEAGSDEYYKIADAIYKAEEQVKNHSNAIEKNTETMKKNEQQILKTHKALLDTIDNEYKARDRQRREMMSAEVSIQNQILNLIRNRYKQEWAIIKEDIARKKAALQEEKSLINERLNARLNADKMQDKAEELAELKRQLALISSDPTRTKDALELSKKIETLEKELADQIAQDEAKAATDAINDEVKALDEYAQYNEKVMNEMLKDANSTQLAEELAAVMGDESMSREDRIANYMDWIRQNDDNYKYGTEAMRMQLEQSNTDSWNKMLGFVETYWDKINEIVGGGLDSILSFMKESWSWRDASEPGRELLELGWADAYEDYLAAIRSDVEYEHGHDLTTAIEDEIYDINDGVWELVGKQKELYDLYTALIEFDYIRPTDVDPDADKIDYRDYAGWGRKTVKVAGETLTFNSNVEKENGNVTKWITVITNAQGDEVMRKTFSSEKEANEWRDSMLKDFSNNGNNFYSGKTARDNLYKLIEQIKSQMNKVEENSEEWLALREKLWAAQKEFDFNNTDAYLILNQIEKQKLATYQETHSHGLNGVRTPIGTKGKNGEIIQAHDTLRALHELGIPGYSSGGLVDFTGLAVLHGSKQNPEYVLNPEETESMREMLNMFSYIATPPMFTLSDKWFGTNSTTIGDINITINQAELNSDMDIEETAREIGRAFARQLERNGLNLAGYTW